MGSASLPTPNQVHDLFKTVRKVGAQWMTLEQQLHRAVKRDRAGSTVPDGYPRSTAGGNGTHPGSSSVEGAAVALADGNIQRDRHHELTAEACEALEAMAIAGNTLRSRLRSITDLTSDAPPAPRRCECCHGKRGKNNNRTDVHRGTVGDRLEQVMDLCRACRGFVEQSCKPGTRAGYLPDDSQIAQHERTGRWRIRVA